MSRSTFTPPSCTKSQPASNVLPLHHSGSTTMSGLRPFEPEAMDRALFKLYNNLLESNPSIYDMVWALNVALNQYGWAINTVESLDCFIETVLEWEAENE
ncbi:hypothetical protein [Enterovibrio norvegicus]|uniref:hypothetical protein n=1 Tax=Enterovibrio norvegicus TaxID=188144 RepID=UPI00352CFEB0